MRVASVKKNLGAIDAAARQLAAILALDARALAQYAREDTHDGWDGGRGAFPKGSIWRQEGQLLYGLVRTLRPLRVADLGTHAGASATHLAAALRANRRGSLVSIDRGFADILVHAGDAILAAALADRLEIRSADPWLLREAQRRGWQTIARRPRVRDARYYGGVLMGWRGSRRVITLPGDVPLPRPGDAIPRALRPLCDVVIGDAAAWLARARPPLDVVFEDLDHDRAGTARVAALAARALTPGGVLICHDALHPRYGAQVRRGLADAGLRHVSCLTVGASDCGLAIWRKPAS